MKKEELVQLIIEEIDNTGLIIQDCATCRWEDSEDDFLSGCDGCTLNLNWEASPEFIQSIENIIDLVKKNFVMPPCKSPAFD